MASLSQEGVCIYPFLGNLLIQSPSIRMLWSHGFVKESVSSFTEFPPYSHHISECEKSLASTKFLEERQGKLRNHIKTVNLSREVPIYMLLSLLGSVVFHVDILSGPLLT